MAKTPSKKDTPKDTAQSPMGDNYVLTLTIPKSVHEPKYQEVVAKTAARVTVPGFRKGKAPVALVEDQIGAATILDRVLEEVLPPIYAEAVNKAGIAPLVQPQVKIVSIDKGKDWVVEAHTALAPEIKLGDWEKVVKAAGKDFKPVDHTGHDHGEPTEEEKNQEFLSHIFAKLIDHVSPKVPPLLLEQEVRRQIEELARNLASHRIELEQFLKSTGKTIDSLQQEYMMSSLANLQVEFIMQEITEELNPEVSEAEIKELVGKDLSTFPKETQNRLREQGTSVVKRQKTVKKLTDLAKA